MANYNTLKDYYQSQGQNLPSIDERAKTFESLGLGKAADYSGSLDQNVSLLGRLSSPASTPASGGSTVKVGTGVGSESGGSSGSGTGTGGSTGTDQSGQTDLEKRISAMLSDNSGGSSSSSDAYNSAMSAIAPDKSKLSDLDTKIANLGQSISDSEQDIRNRTTASGGLVSESQVQRLLAKEKAPLIAEYNDMLTSRNNLASSITSAESNAQKTAELAASDKTSKNSNLVSLLNLLQGEETNAINKAQKEAEARKASVIGTTTDDNGNVTVITQEADGTITKKSLGAVGGTKTSSSGSIPSSYTEWQLAGGLEGTGKTYTQWLNKSSTGTSLFDSGSQIKNIDDILNNKGGLSAAVGQNSLTRMSLGSYLSGSGKQVVASVENLISQMTLDNLIKAKASGATFGALSEGELNALANSATKISKWRIVDKNGNVTGYNANPKDFETELNVIKAGLQKQQAADEAAKAGTGSGSNATGPYSGTSASPYTKYPDQVLNGVTYRADANGNYSAVK